MEKRIVVLWVLLALAFLMACGTPAPPPDIPRYTADQVIEVAKAGTHNPLPDWQRAKVDITWTAEYMGEGYWKVTRNIFVKNGGRFYSGASWKFNERTGKLS